MVKIVIPREWYEILKKIADTKRVSINEVVKGIMDSEDCLGLPEVKPTSRKSIYLDVEADEKELVEKIRKYLFCG